MRQKPREVARIYRRWANSRTTAELREIGITRKGLRDIADMLDPPEQETDTELHSWQKDDHPHARSAPG